MKKLALSTILALLAGSPMGHADEFRPALEAYLEAELRGWIEDPIIIEAVKAQNDRTADYDQDDIDSLDTDWRNTVDSGGSELVDGVLNNTVADFLRARVDAAGGAISEVFAMDAHGLNVAASGPTSDYWQGDEAKFQETYGAGPDAVHFGDIEFDESSQSYQGQISVVLTDPDSGAPIGAITIGVNAEALL